MAQTTPQIGLGTKVEIAPVPGSGSPTYALFGFVNSVTGPQEANALVESTHMQSTAKEYVYAVPDNGDLSVESHYAADNPTHNSSTGVLYFLRNQVPCMIRLTTPGATNSESYNCKVTKAERSMTVDGIMKLSVTFKISGAITTGAAS